MQPTELKFAVSMLVTSSFFCGEPAPLLGIICTREVTDGLIALDCSDQHASIRYTDT